MLDAMRTGAPGPRRATILFSLLLAGLAGCGGSGGDDPAPAPPAPPPAPDPEPEFIEEGLTGLAVNGLYRLDDELLATTDDGIYGKGAGQDSWQPLALQGDNVADLAFVTELRWLATLPSPGQEAPRLLETVNRGSNWQPVDNDFGGENAEAMEPIHALYFDEAGATLYGTGNEALAASTDFGRNWTLLDGTWGALSQPLDALNLNADREQLWYGGQNAIEQMTLCRYDLATGDSSAFNDLLPNPSTIKRVAFHPNRPDLVLASGEGGIARSTDNGGNWSRPLGDVDFRFYFDLAFDPQAPDTVYSAGWEKGVDGPQPLILEVSTDAGESFTAVEYENTQLRGGALSVLAVVEDGETVLYIGLDGGGIVKVLDPDAV